MFETSAQRFASRAWASRGTHYSGTRRGRPVVRDCALQGRWVGDLTEAPKWLHGSSLDHESQGNRGAAAAETGSALNDFIAIELWYDL